MDNPYQLPTGVDDGMQAMQRHDDEIAELTAERDAFRDMLAAVVEIADPYQTGDMEIVDKARELLNKGTE